MGRTHSQFIPSDQMPVSACLMLNDRRPPPTSIKINSISLFQLQRSDSLSLYISLFLSMFLIPPKILLSLSLSLSLCLVLVFLLQLSTYFISFSITLNILLSFRCCSNSTTQMCVFFYHRYCLSTHL